VTTESIQPSVAEIFERLLAALVGRDRPRLEATADLVKRRWALVVLQRDRDTLRTLREHFLIAATTAGSLHDPQFPLERWRHRWVALAEMADLLLELDDEGAAGEDRRALASQFKFALPILDRARWLGVISLSEIRQVGGVPKGWRTQHALNCVRRLVKRGFMVRVSHGLYRLSVRGAAVVRQEGGKTPLARESRAAAQGTARAAAAVTSPVASPMQAQALGSEHTPALPVSRRVPAGQAEGQPYGFLIGASGEAKIDWRINVFRRSGEASGVSGV
jgi:hypothetical protein